MLRCKSKSNHSTKVIEAVIFYWTTNALYFTQLNCVWRWSIVLNKHFLLMVFNIPQCSILLIKLNVLLFASLDSYKQYKQYKSYSSISKWWLIICWCIQLIIRGLKFVLSWIVFIKWITISTSYVCVCLLFK